MEEALEWSSGLESQSATKTDEAIKQLEDKLEKEKDGRKEDRFFGAVIILLLLDVVFFSVMPSLGGPIALLVLELLVLIPFAKRMGMEEISLILSRVLHRVADRVKDGE